MPSFVEISPVVIPKVKLIASIVPSTTDTR